MGHGFTRIFTDCQKICDFFEVLSKTKKISVIRVHPCPIKKLK